MVTNSRQYSAFSCVRQPFSESFFEKTLALDSQIDQTALDVDLFDHGLAGQSLGDSRVSLCGGDGVLRGDVCGHLQTGLDLAVDLYCDLDRALNALGLFVLCLLYTSDAADD